MNNKDFNKMIGELEVILKAVRYGKEKRENTPNDLVTLFCVNEVWKMGKAKHDNEIGYMLCITEALKNELVKDIEDEKIKNAEIDFELACKIFAFLTVFETIK